MTSYVELASSSSKRPRSAARVDVDLEAAPDQRLAHQLGVQSRVFEAEDAQPRVAVLSCPSGPSAYSAPLRGRSLTSAQNMPSCWTASMKLAKSTGLTT